MSRLLGQLLGVGRGSGRELLIITLCYLEHTVLLVHRDHVCVSQSLDVTVDKAGLVVKREEMVVELGITDQSHTVGLVRSQPRNMPWTL